MPESKSVEYGVRNIKGYDHNSKRDRSQPRIAGPVSYMGGEIGKRRDGVEYMGKSALESRSSVKNGSGITKKKFMGPESAKGAPFGIKGKTSIGGKPAMVTSLKKGNVHKAVFE